MKWHEILKSARISKGFSLRQVAQETGLSNPYISQLENGQVKEPSFFKMLRLLSLYGMSVRDLGDTDNQPMDSGGVMKTQFSVKSNNIQISDDETIRQIQIHGTWLWIISAIITGLVIFVTVKI